MTNRKTVAFIGATSAIAEHVARIHAQRGYELVLVGRGEERLAAMAADLRVRGAYGVHTVVADLADSSKHNDIIASALELAPGVTEVLIAQGVLPNQDAIHADSDAVVDAFTVNATSVISMTHRWATHFESKGGGTVAVLSSVAGNRGRKTMYVYGASKAAVSTFADGLRMRMRDKNVQIVTIKPGVIRTKMTDGRALGPLNSSVETAAAIIVRAIDRRRCTVYVPWFWRPIMYIVQRIPEPLFRKLPF